MVPNNVAWQARVKLMALLRPVQREAAAAAHWMASSVESNRRSGRSTAIAAGIVLAALERPSVTVEIFDHIGRRSTRGIVRRQIEFILGSVGAAEHVARLDEDCLALTSAVEGPPVRPEPSRSILRTLISQLLSDGLEPEEIQSVLDEAVADRVMGQ